VIFHIFAVFANPDTDAELNDTETAAAAGLLL
jgi:hypothetical protein